MRRKSSPAYFFLYSNKPTEQEEEKPHAQESTCPDPCADPEVCHLHKRAGAKRRPVFLPEKLRRLFARTYYTLERNLSRLADILGHANVNTTRIYIAESGSVHARQLERMGGKHTIVQPVFDVQQRIMRKKSRKAPLLFLTYLCIIILHEILLKARLQQNGNYVVSANLHLILQLIG